MASISLKDFSREWWKEVTNRIIGAAVYLDEASAECLHWEGGLLSLLDGGAVSVKSLSPFEFSRKEHKKAVFLTQTTSTQLRTIHEIIRHSEFTHCILISCVSLDIVYAELNENIDVSDKITAGHGPAEATRQLEKMLSEWIERKPCAVEVVHIPICTIAPTNVVFLTPPYHHVYPTFDNKLIPTAQTADLSCLTSNERSNARRLASSLNSMMQSFNLKEEVYFMGAYSSMVAAVLQNSPVCLARRKNCTNPASLIIVDRTLDLCGVTSYAMESLLDRIMAVLPRFPGHTNEVAVDMSPLCEANVISVGEDVQLGPGCVYHADDACAQTYDHMINKSQKEVLFDLYHKLSRIDVHKSPPPTNLMRVTPQTVEKIVTACKGNYDLIGSNLGILQQALAVVQTLKSPKKAQLDLLTSLENQAQQSLAASRDSTSVLIQVSQLIKSRKEKNLSLEHLLALIVHIYSLAGTEVNFPAIHEAELRETLSVALCEEPGALMEGRTLNPEESHKLAKKIMARVKDVSYMRKIMYKYHSVLKPREGGGGGFEYRGVLQQMVEELVDARRPELVDVRHRSDGLKELLRTGINILTNKKTRAQRHPFDHPTVIIYVLGGVTGEECKRLHRSVITSGVDNTVLVGSTRLVSPVEAMRAVLAGI